MCTASHLSLVIFQINYYVGDASTLREKGAKESFEVFNISRDTFVNVPVDDQAVPDPGDSSISMIKTSLAPCNCDLIQDNHIEFLHVLRRFNFRAADRPGQLWRRFLTFSRIVLMVSCISMVKVLLLSLALTRKKVL